jgi:hypothetical protein
MRQVKSGIYWRDIKTQGEINGRWVIETQDGTLVADHAPVGADESLTFTAPNGKRYWDVAEHSQWTSRTKENQ